MIGYLPEGARATVKYVVRDFLAFIADVRGLSGAEKRRAIAVAAKNPR
ncbi:MAG: hypothetical protein R3E67_05895 [Pseudomonadales bacterium]